jgi:Family of unknown function (DUF6118)
MWEGGARMMSAAAPQSWQEIIAADHLWRDNEKTIARCLREAGKRGVGKAVVCSVILKAQSG